MHADGHLQSDAKVPCYEFCLLGLLEPLPLHSVMVLTMVLLA